MLIFFGMKRNESSKTNITKSLLQGLGVTQKPDGKVAVPKPVVEKTPAKPSDLSHDAGGAYNAGLGHIQS